VNKYLSFGVNIVKIGPADSEIICLEAIINKRKKLTQAKYIAIQAGMLGGLNYTILVRLTAVVYDQGVFTRYYSVLPLLLI